MFFFSALHAVVHLEKGISEPDITRQRENRRKEKERSQKQNDREDKTTDKNISID